MSSKKRKIEKVKLERKKDKIEIYAAKIVNERGGNVLIEKFSTYYNVNGHILRISNHIGVSSSGNLSIIIPNYDSLRRFKSNYIVHSHQTGEISIMNYEDVKEVVRCYGKMSSIVSNPLQANFDFQFEIRDKFDAKLEEDKINEELTRLRKIEEKYDTLLNKIKQNKGSGYDSLNPTEIFGVPVCYFTEGQMNALKCTAKVALSNAIKKNKRPEDKETLKVLETIIK